MTSLKEWQSESHVTVAWDVNVSITPSIPPKVNIFILNATFLKFPVDFLFSKGFLHIGMATS